ncbi:MAG: ABC transporter permease subunit [Deinococcales bacterium]
MLLFFIEQVSRRRSKNQRQPGLGRYRRLNPYVLKWWQKLIALIICLIPIGLGFIIPAINLLRMALRHLDRLNLQLLLYVRNSFSLALASALLAVFIALILAYGLRLRPTPLNKILSRIAAIGYAVPGAVIAVGVLFFIGSLNQQLPKALMISGIASLIFAYLVRFLAVAYGTVESSLLKITPNLDDAARNLGRRTWQILYQIHIPLLRGSLFSAILLVFVDVIKELPASLIVRPFNFDTLAIRVYRLASDERLAEASVLALIIVLVGLIPVIVLSLAIARSRDN